MISRGGAETRRRRPTKSRGKPQVWYVYILRCANGAFYTGITTDVPKRLAVHNSGKGSAYVRAHRPAEVYAFTRTKTRSRASQMEYAIKAMTRTQKIALAKTWL